MAGETVGTGRKRVLVADDEEQVRRLVCRMLEDMGCEAETACGITHGVAFVNVTPDVAQRLRDLFRPAP